MELDSKNEEEVIARRKRLKENPNVSSYSVVTQCKACHDTIAHVATAARCDIIILDGIEFKL